MALDNHPGKRCTGRNFRLFRVRKGGTKRRHRYALYANISPWSGMIWVSLCNCSCNTLLAAWRTSRSTTGGGCCCLMARTFVEGFGRLLNETKDMEVVRSVLIVLRRTKPTRLYLGLEKKYGIRLVTDALSTSHLLRPRDEHQPLHKNRHHPRCHQRRSKGRSPPRRVKPSPSRVRQSSSQNSSNTPPIRMHHPTHPPAMHYSISIS